MLGCWFYPYMLIFVCMGIPPPVIAEHHINDHICVVEILLSPPPTHTHTKCVWRHIVFMLSICLDGVCHKVCHHFFFTIGRISLKLTLLVVASLVVHPVRHFMSDDYCHSSSKFCVKVLLSAKVLEQLVSNAIHLFTIMRGQGSTSTSINLARI